MSDPNRKSNPGCELNLMSVIIIYKLFDCIQVTRKLSGKGKINI